MKRIVLLAAAVLLLAGPAAAQFTTVTGTVTDPLGIPYANGTANMTLVAAGGGTLPAGPTINGQPCCQNTTAQLDVNGSFTVLLGDNNVIVPAATQWRFTINAAGIPPPLGRGPQSFSVLITITGASQSVTAQLSAAAPQLTVISIGSGGSQHQVNGVNVTTNTPINFINGTNTTVTNPAAGTIRIDAAGSGISGSGVATQCTFWTGALAISGDANCTYAGGILTVNSAYRVGDTIITNSSIGSATAATFTLQDTGAGRWQLASGNFRPTVNNLFDIGDTITPLLPRNISAAGTISGGTLSTTASADGGVLFPNNTTQTVSGATEGRIIYDNATTSFLASVNGGAYAPFGGDSVQIAGGAVAGTVNFLNVTGDGTIPGYTWTLTPGAPDTAAFTMVPASATAAGVVTTGTQTMAGAKTFSGAATFGSTITANGQITLTPAGSVITTDSSSDSLTIRTLNTSGNITGTLTAAGGDSSGTAANTAGNALARGGHATGATGANVAGNMTVQAGGATSTTGIPGQLIVQQSALEGAAVTAGDVVCLSADRTVTACATSSTWIAGVATTSSNPIFFTVAGIATVTLEGSETFVAGDFVCMSASVAGTGTTAGGGTPCVTVATIGRVWVGATAASAQVLLRPIQ